MDVQNICIDFIYIYINVLLYNLCMCTIIVCTRDVHKIYKRYTLLHICIIYKYVYIHLYIYTIPTLKKRQTIYIIYT